MSSAIPAAPRRTKVKTPLRTIFGYAIGEGAVSLTMNGVANFAMLYYTQVLGLGAKYAGLALSITLIWDAVIDPAMGHITDNTRTRFGRRHPYLLWGGIALVISFYFLWSVPTSFTQPTLVFWYLLAMNLLVRTAVSIFAVPYTALGFEICTNYEERSKLQSVRYFFAQAVNLLGGALAWSLFFQDQTTADGTRVDGTRIVENYGHMSITLTLATLLLVGLCIYATKRYAVDNRRALTPHNNLRAFLADIYQVASDRYALYVFAFYSIVSLGTMLVAQVQMFTYVDFMKLTHVQKTIVHGAGMVTFALGSLLQAALVVRYDKKQTGYFGAGIAILGNVMLLILFIGGILPPDKSWIIPAEWPAVGGVSVPISVWTFALFQGMWWGGMGVLTPLTASMIADISEINYRKTGVLKDGSYSAMFSFFSKAAMGVGMFLNGLALDWVGFQAGASAQAPDVIRAVATVTFVAGPLVVLVALPLLWKYPIDRNFMSAIKSGVKDP